MEKLDRPRDKQMVTCVISVCEPIALPFGLRLWIRNQGKKGDADKVKMAAR